MEVAIISPPALLGEFSVRGKFQMALAQMVFACPDATYAEFFRWRRTVGDVVICDNGTAEGETVELSKLWEAADAITAHEVVLPDVWQDGLATVTTVRQALDHCPEHYRYMAVPQGKNAFEWIWCFFELARDTRVHTLGIPKNLDMVFPRFGGRAGVLNWLGQILKHRQIDKWLHLLGIWSDYRELLRYSLDARALIRSVDTSSPVHCGLVEIGYPEPGALQPYDEPDYPMDMHRAYLAPSGLVRQTINRNIDLLLRVAEGDVDVL